MEYIQQRKLIIRIGRNTLSFTMPNLADKERPFLYEPYVVKGGISMAANLREAFKTADLTAIDTRRVQVLIDTPSMLVPIEQFDEEDITTIFNYTFTPSREQRTVRFNVLPSLKAVCLFAVNKDLAGVLQDRFDDLQFIHAMTPVWRHLHQRSFTRHYNKLFGYFHGKQLDIFGFQQNRFKFCNTFEAAHMNDALYFLLHVWKQLCLETEHDEMHLVGDIPEQTLLLDELRRYLRKAYVINPAADFQQASATKITEMPYDLITLLTKGQ